MLLLKCPPKKNECTTMSGEVAAASEATSAPSAASNSPNKADEVPEGVDDLLSLLSAPPPKQTQSNSSTTIGEPSSADATSPEDGTKTNWEFRDKRSYRIWAGKFDAGNNSSELVRDGSFEFYIGIGEKNAQAPAWQVGKLVAMKGEENSSSCFFVCGGIVRSRNAPEADSEKQTKQKSKGNRSYSLLLARFEGFGGEACSMEVVLCPMSSKYLPSLRDARDSAYASEDAENAADP